MKAIRFGAPLLLLIAMIVFSMSAIPALASTPPTVTATLQGTNRPYDGYNVPLTLKLYDPAQQITTGNVLSLWNTQGGPGVPGWLYQYSTAASTITITNIDTDTRTITFEVAWNCPDGYYNILLYSPQNLLNLKNGVLINASQTSIDMSELKEGDAVDITESSLTIDISDFTRFVAAYESVPGSPIWDSRADFDRDLSVGITDFSLLDANYGKTSPQTVGGQGLSAMTLDSFGNVDVSLGVPAQPVTVGNNFNVTIDVAAGTQPVAAIAAYINFDPAILEVVSITPGETLENVLSNEYNNTSGKLKLVVGKALGTEPATGSFTLGTIVFHAKSPSPGTQLTHERTFPWKTMSAYAGAELPGTISDNQVKVILPLTVQTTLQGSQRPYPDGYNVPLTMKLYNTSPEITSANILDVWNSPLYDYTTAAGEIVITNIDQQTRTITFSVSSDAPAGTYQVLLYSPQNLVNKKNNVAINPSQSSFGMGTLKEGDAKDINEGSKVIDITDYSILVSAYGSHGPPNPSPNWDARADFDRTNWVDISDYSMLYTNYGKTSPQTVTEGLMAGGSQATGLVDLSLAADSTRVVRGSTFTANIQVNAASQPLSALAAYLSFDPQYLEVVSVTPGSTLSVVFSNAYDNTNGKVELGLGRDLGLGPASGAFSAAQIKFRAKKVTSCTSITFDLNPPGVTDVAFAGESVLGSTTGIQITITPR